MPHTLYLTQKGRIWSQKPQPIHNGLMFTVVNNNESSNTQMNYHHHHNRNMNGYHHQSSQLSNTLYAFDLVTFDENGENLACVDKRGNLFVFKLVLNKYSLVRRIGTTVTSLQFSKLKNSELLVALKDNSIHCYNIGKRR
jgi:hypothetical protein